MYSVFSFSAIYVSKNGRPRTPSDMLECIKTDNNKTYILTNFWGDYKTLHDTIECIKHDIPKSECQHLICNYQNRNGGFEFLYEGIVIYEDGRAITVYGKDYN